MKNKINLRKGDVIMIKKKKKLLFIQTETF